MHNGKMRSSDETVEISRAMTGPHIVYMKRVKEYEGRALMAALLVSCESLLGMLCLAGDTTRSLVSRWCLSSKGLHGRLRQQQTTCTLSAFITDVRTMHFLVSSLMVLLTGPSSKVHFVIQVDTAFTNHGDVSGLFRVVWYHGS
jgi:hypothetical protein